MSRTRRYRLVLTAAAAAMIGAASLAAGMPQQAAPPPPAVVAAIFPPPRLWVAFVPAPVPSRQLLQAPPRATNPRGPPA